MSSSMAGSATSLRTLIKNKKNRLEGARGREMDVHEREQAIKEQTVLLWRIFSRRLKPDESGSDLMVVQDYIKALERVPNKNIADIFDRAKKMDSLPRPNQMAELWRPTKQAQSDEKYEPFRPDFREYLQDTAAMADKRFSDTDIQDYRTVAEICDQADMQCLGALQRITQIKTTQGCIDLIHDWAKNANVSQTIISEVM